MTYAELITKVQAWAHRSDLAPLMPDFLELAESKINRALRVREMEGTLSATIDAGNEVALPADFAAIRTLWPAAYPSVRIIPQTLEAVIGCSRVSGTPTLYAVTADALRFDGTGDVEGVYFKRIPSLEANTTNWLSEAHPDLYLWAVLAEVAAYTLDTNQGAFYSAKAAESMQNIQNADTRDRFHGSLTARKG
jgi:hypothetical protein